jgi:hypothetical protein
MPNIFSHEGNENQNYIEILPPPSYNENNATKKVTKAGKDVEEKEHFNMW